MNKNRHCYILLNGNPPPKSLFDSLNLSGSIFICVDGAYKNLPSEFKEKVDILLGDFDSLDLETVEVLPNITLKSFPKEKNFTDGFLAVEEAHRQGVDSITILGASGGRIDHEINNYTLLSVAKSLNLDAKIVNSDFEVYLADKEIAIDTFVGAIISVVPFGDMVHILYSDGLKYPAGSLKMSKIGADCLTSVMGISNIATSNRVELLLEGSALIFAQREGLK